MKQLKVLVIIITMSNITMGQTLKIQTGTTFTFFNYKGIKTEYQPDIHPEAGYSVFAGIDYLNRKYLNLSSNIGIYSKKAKGELVVYYTLDQYSTILNPKLDYMSVNSQIHLKYPLKKEIIPFFSLGPRMDYVIRSNENYYADPRIYKYSYGLIVGSGIKNNLSDFQVGLTVEYYLNFNPFINSTSQDKINDKTIAINLIIGYKL